MPEELFLSSPRGSLLFREDRLIFFAAMERHDIPVPYAHEDFERTLITLKSERDAFRRAYQQSLESLPDTPAIAPDVLRSLPDEEADRVFRALENEGRSAGDVLLLQTHRSTEREYEHCKQQVYEQMLLLNALKDVRKIQTLLYDYMRRQTARGNLNDDPEQSKKNRAKAFALLEIISEIGNGNCRFPEQEKKKEQI